MAVTAAKDWEAFCTHSCCNCNIPSTLTKNWEKTSNPKNRSSLFKWPPSLDILFRIAEDKVNCLQNPPGAYFLTLKGCSNTVNNDCFGLDNNSDVEIVILMDSNAYI
jgi:hypothetical protein